MAFQSFGPRITFLKIIPNCCCAGWCGTWFFLSVSQVPSLLPFTKPTTAYVRKQRIPISAVLTTKAKMAAGGMELLIRFHKWSLKLLCQDLCFSVERAKIFIKERSSKWWNWDFNPGSSSNSCPRYNALTVAQNLYTYVFCCASSKMFKGYILKKKKSYPRMDIIFAFSWVK